MEDNFQIMDDYLKGNLSPEGVRLFNSKLKNEPEFEVEFREMKAIQEAAHASAKLSTMAKLQEIEMSISEKETTKIEFSMKKLVSVAASLVLIATVSYFTVFNTPNVATGQEIYSEYYQPYQNRITGTQRGERNNSFDNLTISAYTAYDLKDYSLAANLFVDLLKVDNSAANVFYLGISNLELGNINKAKESFKTVINDYEEFEAQSKWFLAMSLLKEDTEESVDEAVYSLAELIIDQTSYKSDATAALTKLGLTVSNEEGTGSVDVVNTGTAGDSPDGSYEEVGKRGYQWGKLTSSNGGKYRFFSNPPIIGLERGDEVVFYGVQGRRKMGKGKMGWAIILDTIK